MSYSQLRDDYATYAIDWGIVERLVRAYHRARARDMYSTVTSTSQTDWYNPFSWSMPDIKSVDVDWDRVQTTALTQADYDLNRLAERATHDVRDL
jgi:predicted nucleotidyltransferase component of viral defense system